MTYRTRFLAATLVLLLTASDTIAGAAVHGDSVRGGRPPTQARAATAATCPDPGGGVASREDPPDDGRPVVVYGLGRGHSLGMSQYGARGAGRLGCSSGQILATYYPGTRRVTRQLTDPVTLWMLRQGRRATVTAERDPDRNARIVWRHRGEQVAVQPEGGTWTVRWAGNRTQLIGGAGNVRFDRRTTGRYPLRAWHKGRVVRLRTFRSGQLVTERRVKYDAIKFNVVSGRLNVKQTFFTDARGTAMDKYLWGIAEVPASWPRASLRAQAIAARTFAARANRTLWPTTADQYYGGYDPLRDAPTSRWRQAVDRSSGRIIVDGSGRPIEALYTTSLGGWSEDARYVWGGSGQPYLRAVKDTRWTQASDDPTPRWVRSFTYRRFADEFGFGRVTDVSVARRRTEQRLRGVRIDGVVNGRPTTKFVTGWAVARALGLPSPGFIIETR